MCDALRSRPWSGKNNAVDAVYSSRGNSSRSMAPLRFAIVSEAQTHNPFQKNNPLHLVESYSSVGGVSSKLWEARSYTLEETSQESSHRGCLSDLSWKFLCRPTGIQTPPLF